MIKAEFSMNEKKMSATLKLNGHADAGEYGKDIICSSASILAYTLAQNIKLMEGRGMLGCKPRITLKEGNASIVATADSDVGYDELMHTFVVIEAGFALLAHNYPEYVSIKMFGQG